MKMGMRSSNFRCRRGTFLVEKLHFSLGFLAQRWQYRDVFAFVEALAQILTNTWPAVYLGDRWKREAQLTTDTGYWLQDGGILDSGFWDWTTESYPPVKRSGHKLLGTIFGLRNRTIFFFFFSHFQLCLASFFFFCRHWLALSSGIWSFFSSSLFRQSALKCADCTVPAFWVALSLSACFSATKSPNFNGLSSGFKFWRLKLRKRLSFL